MLINCGECGKQISDKAVMCPHCGYPIGSNLKKIKVKAHKRLPNGFGQITKVTYHNLNKPYRVMTTIGVNEKGKPIVKLLEPVAYFKTYNEAYEALLNYNKLKNNSGSQINMTMNDLYEKWIKNNFDQNINKKTLVIYRSNWNICKDLHDVQISSLTVIKLKEFIENLNTTSGQKIRIRNMLSTMLKYAISLDLIDKNIASNIILPIEIKMDSKNKYRGHESFTLEEMKILWNNTDNKIVKLILVQCFMGWRPTELCSLRKENININDMIITAGVKTESGKNRSVPIHPLIQNFVIEIYNDLCNRNTALMFYITYRSYFIQILKKIGIKNNHKPHDCRVTFITNCKTNGVEEYSIKRFAGHKIQDITESVYTKHDIKWFKNEINKLKKYVYE